MKKDAGAALRREIKRTEEWIAKQEEKLEERLKPQRVSLEAMKEALKKIDGSTAKQEDLIP